MNLNSIPRPALAWVGALVAWCILFLFPLSMHIQSTQLSAAASRSDWDKLTELLPRYHPRIATTQPVHHSVIEIVNNLATRAGIDSKSLTKLEEVNGAARISFSVVPGDALIRFLVAVQDRGLVLEQWDMNATQTGIWSGNGLVKTP